MRPKSNKIVMNFLIYKMIESDCSIIHPTLQRLRVDFLKKIIKNEYEIFCVKIWPQTRTVDPFHNYMNF